mmetsp:Transcript_7688/g.10971  ORF Transcript_7688/g.10971 Transcript_7688/m.10971 type:complete len:270 (+) Transcript_7688:498-1307(+)
MVPVVALVRPLNDTHNTSTMYTDHRHSTRVIMVLILTLLQGLVNTILRLVPDQKVQRMASSSSNSIGDHSMEGHKEDTRDNRLLTNNLTTLIHHQWVMWLAILHHPQVDSGDSHHNTDHRGDHQGDHLLPCMEVTGCTHHHHILPTDIHHSIRDIRLHHIMQIIHTGIKIWDKAIHQCHHQDPMEKEEEKHHHLVCRECYQITWEERVAGKCIPTIIMEIPNSQHPNHPLVVQHKISMIVVSVKMHNPELELPSCGIGLSSFKRNLRMN